MERLTAYLSVPVGCVWMLAGPVTYVLEIVDTWQTNMSIVGKLVVCVTIDAILAGLWPVTWIIWIVQYFTGHHSPLNILLG